jgi:hypothetical protein
MENRDIKLDRAKYLFEQVKPELLKILRNAPEYGSCGIDIVLHQGEIIRLMLRAEVAHKLKPRTGGT